MFSIIPLFLTGISILYKLTIFLHSVVSEKLYPTSDSFILPNVNIPKFV